LHFIAAKNILSELSIVGGPYQTPPCTREKISQATREKHFKVPRVAGTTHAGSHAKLLTVRTLFFMREQRVLQRE
jgi:hypothetical protein